MAKDSEESAAKRKNTNSDTKDQKISGKKRLKLSSVVTRSVSSTKQLSPRTSKQTNKSKGKGEEIQGKEILSKITRQSKNNNAQIIQGRKKVEPQVSWN